MPEHVGRIVKKKLHDRNRGQYLSLGMRIAELYYSILGFDDDEASWSFDSVLGYGSFGIAALYNNVNGDVSTVNSCK